MLYQIVSHTPLWVWALLGGLLWLGLRQTRPTAMGLRRIVLLPLAMVGLSLFGTVQAFGASAMALGSWLAGAALMATWIMRRALPSGTQLDPATQTVRQTGSWTPLWLILAIFTTKYAIAISLAIQPALASNMGFAVGISAFSGVISGVFAGRALRLIRLFRGAPRASDADVSTSCT